jgi:DNA adenine methylase
MREPWAYPFLRWAGSKRKLLSILMANVPSTYNRYVEPFCGSSCLFFALHPRSSILSDINEELIHCYSVLQKHPRLLSRLVHVMPNTHDDYLAYRKQLPTNLNPIERAARFLYLNRYCFNGVYRTNKKGAFNVPRGSRTGALPSESVFFRCSYALRNTKLLAGDFEICINQIKKDDLVYLDPPYATSDKPTIQEYGPNSFQREDIPRLIKALFQIDKKKATFIMSYADSEELLGKIDPSWNVSKVSLRRHVAGFAKHRENVCEILVSNRQFSIGCS